MKYIILLIALSTIVFAHTVSAVTQPTVRFIPSNFSINASFLAVAETTDTGSIRMSWIVPGFGSYGQFPKSENKYVCYFSDIDSENTCGPYPFPRVTGNLVFTAWAFDPAGNSASRDTAVNVGGIGIDPLIQINGKEVSLAVFPSSAVTGMQYVVYKNDLTLFQGSRNMECKIVSGSGYQCIANTTLDVGEYFIAFTATSSSDFGGDVRKITITGEGPVGSGAPKKVNADSVNFAALINRNQLYEVSNFKIINLGNQTLSGLSVSVPQGLRNVLNILLQNTTIQPFGSILFSVRLTNIDAPTGVFTFVDVFSGSDKIGTIPVNITVSVKDVSAPVSSTLPVSPNSFSGDFLISVGGVRQDFTVTNPTSQAIITFGQPSYTGNIQGITTLNTPSGIQPGGSGTVSVTLSPTSAGQYQGSISIPTDAGLISIIFITNFYPDLSANVDKLKDEFNDLQASFSSEQTNKLGLIISDVDSAIRDAESSFEARNYRQANTNIEIANAKLAMLQSFVAPAPTTNGEQPPLPISENIIIIVVAVIIVLVLVVVVLKKVRKKKGPKGGEEEEFEEELEGGEEEEF